MFGGGGDWKQFGMPSSLFSLLRMLYSKYPHNENARKKKEKTNQKKKKKSIALASGNKLCAWAEREATTQNVVCVCES